MSGFLLALAAVGIPAALIFYLEYRSRPRDPKQEALRAANRGPAALRDQLERERNSRKDRG